MDLYIVGGFLGRWRLLVGIMVEVLVLLKNYGMLAQAPSWGTVVVAAVVVERAVTLLPYVLACPVFLSPPQSLVA